MTKQIEPIFVASGIILDGGHPLGRILVSGRPDDEASAKRGCFEFVGGKCEGERDGRKVREIAHDVAVEARDEVGLKLSPRAMVYFGENSYRSRERILRVFRMLAPRSFGQKVRIPAEELQFHDKFKWVTPDSYQELKYVSGVRDCIRKIFTLTVAAGTSIVLFPNRKLVHCALVDADFKHVVLSSHQRTSAPILPSFTYFDGRFPTILRQEIKEVFPYFNEQADLRGQWLQVSPTRGMVKHWHVPFLLHTPRLVEKYAEHFNGKLVFSVDEIAAVLSDRSADSHKSTLPGMLQIGNLDHIRGIVKAILAIRRKADKKKVSPASLLSLLPVT